MAGKRISPQGTWLLHVSLQDCEPTIWRRILVTGDTSLHHLHWVLQVTMGWTNSHLHQFYVGETCYGLPDPEWGAERKDERKASLALIAPGPEDRFIYEYDFGDSWTHDILVEAITPPSLRDDLPVCVEGERACPPEDCGGAPGYENLLRVLGDPAHEEHSSMLQWLGGPFDAERFDVRDVNRILRFERPQDFL